MAPQESDEDYLDDPIQLIDIEQKKITEAVKHYDKLNGEPVFEATDSDEDLYIEKNHNIPEKSSPRFKKVSITLPVTFFDIPRNVEQLNKCKPLYIKVVKFDKHPWYYKKYLNKFVFDSDIEVDYTKKSCKAMEKVITDVVMNDEGRKIKIRPVASPYENLKVGISPKSKTSLERRKSKLLVRENIKNVKQDDLCQQNSMQVDFKKNLGLIGMKITQTHEKFPEDIKKKPKEIKSKLTKKHEKSPKSEKKTPKVYKNKNKSLLCSNASDAEPANVMNKTENIFKIDSSIITKVQNEIDEKSVTSTEKDKTVSENINVYKNNERVADKVESVNYTKVKDVIDEVVQNSIKNSCKLNSIIISKTQDDKVVPNNAKAADKSNVVSDKKYYTNSDLKTPKTIEHKKTIDYLNYQDNNIVQSVFFSVNNNVQKSSAIIKEPEKCKPIEVLGSEVTANSVTKKDWATKTSFGINITKTNSLANIQSNVRNEKKGVDKDENLKKLKKTQKKKCGSGAKKTTGNISLNSGPLTATKTTSDKNIILNMELHKPKKNSVKKEDSSKLTQSNNQKGKCVPNVDRKIKLIKGKTSSVKQLVIKNYIASDTANKSAEIANGNNVTPKLLTSKIVEKANLDYSDNKCNTNLTKKSMQLKSVSRAGKLTDSNKNITDYSASTVGNRQPSSFYVEKYAKIMEPSPQQISNNAPAPQVLNQQCNPQIPTPLEDVRCSKNMIVVGQNESMTIRQLSSDNFVSKVMPKSINISDTNNRSNNTSDIFISKVLPKSINISDSINRNNNYVPNKQKLPENMNLSSTVSITKCNATSAPTSTTTQSVISAGIRIAGDSSFVPNQPMTSINNIVTRPGALQIPLNIPLGQKRCPRVLKISKRNHDLAENSLHNNNTANGTLQNTMVDGNATQKNMYHQNQLSGQHNPQNLAKLLDPNTDNNMPSINLNKVPSSQPHQIINNHQGHPIQTLINKIENLTKQKPPALHQDQVASNSQMLSYFHAAAQQISGQPALQQPLAQNQQNTREQDPLQQPMPNNRQTMQPAPQQPMPNNRQTMHPAPQHPMPNTRQTMQPAPQQPMPNTRQTMQPAPQQPMPNTRQIMQLAPQQPMPNTRQTMHPALQHPIPNNRQTMQPPPQQPMPNTRQTMQPAPQHPMPNTRQTMHPAPQHPMPNTRQTMQPAPQHPMPNTRQTMHPAPQHPMPNTRQTMQPAPQQPMPNTRPTMQPAPQQPMPNTRQIMQPLAATDIKAGNHLQNIQYKPSQEVLPPTCDVAAARTTPRSDTPNFIFQPQQKLGMKKHIPHIILRNIGPKPKPKQQTYPNLNIPSAASRPNLHTVIPQDDIPQHSYPSNLGYNIQHNAQPFGQQFQQHYSDVSHILPQNYIHCAPIYDGFPSNMMNPANSVPYDNYWNNYYPMMMPPPPPPPLYPKPVQQPIQSTNQATASYNQNYITTASKSVAGTTIIGCNNDTGPVRKINILSEPSEAFVAKPDYAVQTPLKPVQPPQDKNDLLISKNNVNSDQKLFVQKKNDNNTNYPGIQHFVDPNVKETPENSHTANSKREMLEELSKITTIESSSPSPVKDLKRPMSNTDTIQETATFIKRPKPGPLSKKFKLNSMTPSQKQISPVAQKGYSPPILPIPTYEKTLEILARSNMAESILSTTADEGTDASNITNKHSSDESHDRSSKKISLNEYKKRVSKPDDKLEPGVNGDLQIDRIKMEIKSEHPDQDLGYDSDSTIKR